MTKFDEIFNSTTIRGRANVAKATYASIAALYLYSRFKRSKKKPIEKNPETTSSVLSYADCDDKNLSDTKINQQQDLHEATPPIDSGLYTAICKPQHGPHDSTDDAETNVIVI